jgi:HMG-box domain
MFFREERQKVLNLDFQTMGKEISSRWRNTSKGDRARFEELAKEDSRRYKNEVQLFEEEQVLATRTKRQIMERKMPEKPYEIESESAGGEKTERKAVVEELASSAAAMAVLASLQKNDPGNWQIQGTREQRIHRQRSPHWLRAVQGSNGPPGDAMAQIEAGQCQPQMNAVPFAEELNAIKTRALQNRMGLGGMLSEQHHRLGLDVSSQAQIPLAIIERLRLQEEAMAALGASGGVGETLPYAFAYPSTPAASMYGRATLAGFSSLPSSTYLESTGGATFHGTSAFARVSPPPSGLNLQSDLVQSSETNGNRELLLRLTLLHSKYS